MERTAQSIGVDTGTGSAVGGDQHVGEAGAQRDADGAGPHMEASRGGATEPAPAVGKTDRTDSETGRGGRTGGSELNSEEARKRYPAEDTAAPLAITPLMNARLETLLRGYSVNFMSSLSAILDRLGDPADPALAHP